jgi:hypothetical protein
MADLCNALSSPLPLSLLGYSLALAVISSTTTDRVLAICAALAVLIMAGYFSWKAAGKR